MFALRKEAVSASGVEEGCSEGASLLGVRYPPGLASFGVKGDLLVRLKAALRVGVKGLARGPLFCLSEVIVAGLEGRKGGGRLMALRDTTRICKHGGTRPADRATSVA
jgi:hypothetical protein